MKISTQLRRMADINDILESMDIDARLFISGNKSDVFWYLLNLTNGKTAYSMEKEPLRNIIAAGRDCDSITWTKISEVCIKVIGEELWVDKEVAITVASISADKNLATVKSTTGRTYNTDSLYIKG